jgi:cytochrome P450
VSPDEQPAGRITPELPPLVGPQDNLLSALDAVRDEEDGRLNEAALVGADLMLIAAGHERAVKLLGIAVPAPPQPPAQRG